MLNKIMIGLCIVNLLLAVLTHNLSAGCGWFVAGLAYTNLEFHHAV